MDQAGSSPAYDRIGLAGAFGSFIDPKYALVLGLVPDCDLDKVKAVGNAAGTGARMALLNRNHRREIEHTVTRIEKIETALEPKFQEHFVNAMAFPNKIDAFAAGGSTEVVQLPERPMDTPTPAAGNRTRRRPQARRTPQPGIGRGHPPAARLTARQPLAPVRKVSGAGPANHRAKS